MKDYYIFPNAGSPIKIEQDVFKQLKLTLLDNSYHPPVFTKEKLEIALKEFLIYLEKYGKDIN